MIGSRPASTGALVAACLAGCSSAPSIYRPAGSPADLLSTLGWWVSAVMAAVVVVTCALYLIGAVRAERRGVEWEKESAERERRGLRWVIVGGAIVPAAILIILFGFTLSSMLAVSRSVNRPAWTIRITGNQWWWEVEYTDETGDIRFVTANEIHVPVGEPVALELGSADVIHSFWVPQLAGKTDLIPGRVNRAWLEADRPGVYYGQCAEFCGRSHALMRIRISAQEPAEFRRWVDRMRRSPGVEPDGMQVFRESGCAACHRIAGTMAQGIVGPDLSHVGARRTIAAGLLENTPENMAEWLRSPGSFKPGARMPDLELGREEVARLVTFLEGLE
jgi:cytochrome c oxidase subunit 2